MVSPPRLTLTLTPHPHSFSRLASPLLTCPLQASINLKNYPSACEAATSALEKGDPRNVKALFRRGLARNHMGLPEEALADLSLALEEDPTNKPVKVSVRVCNGCGVTAVV